ncbi:STAS-like domain-containing protein [Myroides marinus]|uniref:STAS-like domain-containing protein n=1 Tax=Myroides marinus TaxID=703342 RepID=UPI002578E463|nr:STAS-like domain-containing protein [Myroides marinus]MDM1368856.1 STAS-like domain-containing protein [Myroides marinus]MDM1375662.1 STAS-like domain-containing protein [Myroides marinus]MDM1382888.1 STAS-like domain-containing protein [Myroides marinus]
MCSVIEIKEFGPIVSNKETGEKIYQMITDALKKEAIVTVDLEGILSMATFCAKQIFGKLYLDLEPHFFFERIKIKNANNDLKLIINMGIHSAINDQNK